jgi:hypothetical protein
MAQRIRGHLSFANVTSFIALAIALGGTSYAAATLPRNSVGSAQIKKSGVASSDIKSNAVTGAKVKDASLTAADFAANQLKAGPAGQNGAAGAPGTPGAQGVQGVQGLQGAPGLLSSVVVHRTDVALPAGAGVGLAGVSTSGFATCAAGETIIGGSASIANATDPPVQEIVVSRSSVNDVGTGTVPTDGGSFAFWKGTGRTLTNAAGTMRVFAYCAVP